MEAFRTSHTAEHRAKSFSQPYLPFNHRLRIIARFYEVVEYMAFVYDSRDLIVEGSGGGF